ncbi:MAG TPA: hybrid sensor histidine kinase/response regulator [Casimicrobiaceae bacterium]|nr:hybrid sensor histidine kinase/response regulator [Casimicrobiaceae bacterium]
MSGNLLRALAHELRNSMAPIVNAVHLIRLRHGNDPDLAGALSIIDRQLSGMTRTLEAVGEADRLTCGETVLHRERVDLVSAIRSAVLSKKALIDSRRQSVRVVADSGPVWVDGDQARLVQAVGNVLDNAVRYTDEAGEITIEVASSSGEADVRVRDNGRGIPADVLPHVFEAFALHHPARAGLGLGLTIARAVCELHGGRISARSEGDGRGSEFSIGLPLSAQNPDRPAAPGNAAGKSSAAKQAPGARRILVADDNQAVRNSFAAILKQMGHEVRLAADGVQALEVAEAWSPEFVIVDVHMPKIDGYGVARRLRERFPPTQMQLVMMSGTDLDPMTLLGAKEAGFDHCVDKTLAVKGLDALLRGEAPPVPA